MIYEVKGNINSHLFKFPWRSLSVGYKSIVFYGNVIHNIKYSFLTDGLQDIRFKTQFCGIALVKKSAGFYCDDRLCRPGKPLAARHSTPLTAGALISPFKCITLRCVS